MTIPPSLKEEHEELHRELSKLIDSGGEIGKLANNVAEILHPHFLSEEELAMPLLGNLFPLSRGIKLSETETSSAIEKSKSLEKQLPKMLAEHKEIYDALGKLAKVSPKFAEKLKLHARNEEEVLYPAAILTGKYLESLNGK